MAILARHLHFDFPAYWNVFGRKSSYAAGKRVWTTNRLLTSYRGADGIKTGYTRAAGYNLAASARRGSERVIAVVFGGKSSRWRNARVAELLDKGFARAAEPRRDGSAHRRHGRRGRAAAARQAGGAGDRARDARARDRQRGGRLDLALRLGRRAALFRGAAGPARRDRRRWWR